MKHTFDFHVHTHLSDGDPGQSPERVVAAAVREALDHVGLTDHDHMIGREECRALAAAHQIDVVNGCEVSCYWNRPTTGEKVLIHLGGHWLDPEDRALVQILKHNQSVNFEGYIKEMLYACRKLGLQPYGEDVDRLYERVKFITPESFHRGKRAVVQVLTFGGCVENRQEGYKLLAHGGPAHVAPRRFLHFVGLEDAMEAINHTGLSTLNHLHYYHLGGKGDRELLRRVKELGCQAMEVEYTRYDKRQQGRLLKLCEEFDLLPNSGSDRHDETRRFMKGTGKYFLDLWRRQLELHGTTNS